MTKEEHFELIKQIKLNLSDEGKVTEYLTQLSDDYQQTLTSHEMISTEIENLKKDNESLRDTNMRLFTRIGEAPKKDEKPENSEEDKLTFDDLFDENGNLK